MNFLQLGLVFTKYTDQPHRGSYNFKYIYTYKHTYIYLYICNINKIQKNKVKIREELLSLECLKDDYVFTPVFLCYEYT